MLSATPAVDMRSGVVVDKAGGKKGPRKEEALHAKISCWTRLFTHILSQHVFQKKTRFSLVKKRYRESTKDRV